MAVSKRARFEVLRRDGFRCRYCGIGADKAELTVDHVTPVALGGADDSSNLVTACEPCNNGKTSTAPDGTILSLLPAPTSVSVATVQRSAWGVLAEYSLEDLAAPLSSDPVAELNVIGVWCSVWQGGHSDEQVDAVRASVTAVRVGFSAPVLYAAAQHAARDRSTDVRPYAQAIQHAAMAALHALPTVQA